MIGLLSKKFSNILNLVLRGQNQEDTNETYVLAYITPRKYWLHEGFEFLQLGGVGGPGAPHVFRLERIGDTGPCIHVMSVYANIHTTPNPNPNFKPNHQTPNHPIPFDFDAFACRNSQTHLGRETLEKEGIPAEPIRCDSEDLMSSSTCFHDFPLWFQNNNNSIS